MLWRPALAIAKSRTNNDDFPMTRDQPLVVGHQPAEPVQLPHLVDTATDPGGQLR